MDEVEGVEDGYGVPSFVGWVCWDVVGGLVRGACGWRGGEVS